MPNPDHGSALFIRWLWLVYLPLAGLALVVVLLALGVLSGGWIWLTALLALYCVIPARLLIETRRKGLAFPKPGPGGRRPSRPPRPRPTDRRPAAAIEQHEPSTVLPVRYRRRRAVLALLGLGVLTAIGAGLFIVGLGRVASSSGIFLVLFGGFLMILSVTLPLFKLVDAFLRAAGRLVSRPQTRRQPAARQPGTTRRQPARRAPAARRPAARRSGARRPPAR